MAAPFVEGVTQRIVTSLFVICVVGASGMPGLVPATTAMELDKTL